MARFGLAMLVSAWLLAGVAFAAEAEGGGTGAPEDAVTGWFAPGEGGAGDGSATGGSADAATLSALEAAQALMAQEGQEEQATSAALKLLPALESAKDTMHLAECLTLIGEGYYYTGQWSSAQRYMRRAWDTGLAAFGDAMSTFPLRVIGEAQFELGQYTEALATFTQRVEVLRGRADVEELGGALYDAASALVKLERGVEALPLLDEAAAANAQRQELLDAPDSGATADEREAVLVDGAEIALLSALIDVGRGMETLAKPKLVAALAQFEALPAAALPQHADRMVWLLDHLVVLCEQLGDTAGAAQYRARRDALNQ